MDIIFYIASEFEIFFDFKVITIALSCIRTIDAEHMPFLLRFLLLSATPANFGRIISQIREQLKFVGLSNSRAMHQKKLKGKSHMDGSEAPILDALRSSLRFKNVYFFFFPCCLRKKLYPTFLLLSLCPKFLFPIDALPGDFERTELASQTSRSQSH